MQMPMLGCLCVCFCVFMSVFVCFRWTVRLLIVNILIIVIAIIMIAIVIIVIIVIAVMNIIIIITIIISRRSSSFVVSYQQRIWRINTVFTLKWISWITSSQGPCQAALWGIHTQGVQATGPCKNGTSGHDIPPGNASRVIYLTVT